MPHENTAKLFDQPPKYITENATNFVARVRGKENVKIDDDNGLFPSLFSKTVTAVSGQNMPDNIAGLRREFEFLTRLRSSGVTPIPIVFKFNQDKQKAHLLMTKVPGKSLNNSEISKESTTKFGETVTAVLAALKIIHAMKVLVVDVNSGTFVLDELEGPDKSIKTHVVDFELARDFDELGNDELNNRITTWYATTDIGVELAQMSNDFELTPTNAMKIERYLAAKAIVEHFLGLDYSWEIDLEELSLEDTARYNHQLQQISPKLNIIAKRKVDKSFADLQESRIKDPTIPNSTCEDWCAYALPKEVQALINESMINISLPYLLTKNGITTSQEIAKLLTTTLNPVVQDRP